MATIGIAFGNSTSSIAFVRDDGKVEVIADPDGDRFIASALSYVGQDEYHGSQAIGQLIRNEKNTVINFRDHLGGLCKNIVGDGHSAVAKEEGGKVVYEINGETVSVEEIIRRHLKQILKDAEDYLGEKVEGAVMTVPVDFTEKQKGLLKEIAGKAGLNVLQFIHEPSAALLAYLNGKEELNEDKVYVVADFGGVRSDVAVVAVRGGIFTILSSESTYELGGKQLDEALMQFFAKDFQKKYKANALALNKSWAKLDAASIITKKTLSNVESSPVSVDSLADGFDYISSINRMKFEVVARQVFSQMAAFVENVVKKAGLETLDIDAVLLSGGSSNIPRIARNMEFIFPENTNVAAPSLDTKLVNPNELNARGAALQASLISGFDAEEIAQSQGDVVVKTHQLPFPIGLKGSNGEFLTILPQHSVYPIKKSVSFKASGVDALVEIYEGKRSIKETVEEADPEDSEDEPETIREVEYVPSKLLAQLALRGLEEGAKVDVIVNIRKEGKMLLTARSGSIIVKGTL